MKIRIPVRRGDRRECEQADPRLASMHYLGVSRGFHVWEVSK